MRIVTLFFSLYIFTMACYPCMDADTCVDEKHQGYEVNTADHDHSSNEDDHCSPFCSCSCCSVTMQLVSSVISIQVSFTDYSAFITPYQESPWLGSAYAIWQPPKLA